MLKSFLNPEGHGHHISGSKVTVILLKGLILPNGGVALGRIKRLSPKCELKYVFFCLTPPLNGLSAFMLNKWSSTSKVSSDQLSSGGLPVLPWSSCRLWDAASTWFFKGWQHWEGGFYSFVLLFSFQFIQYDTLMIPGWLSTVLQENMVKLADCGPPAEKSVWVLFKDMSF